MEGTRKRSRDTLDETDYDATPTYEEIMKQVIERYSKASFTSPFTAQFETAASETPNEVLTWGITMFIEIWEPFLWEKLPYKPELIVNLKSFSPAVVCMTVNDPVNLQFERYFENDNLVSNISELARITCLNGRVIHQFPKETLKRTMFLLLKNNADVACVEEVEEFFK